MLYTWKGSLWLLISSLIFSFTSYLLLTDRELSLLDQTEMLWLLSKVIIGVGLLVAVIDASSAITSEFEKETAEGLFLAPLTVRGFVLGKFMASMALWLAVFVVALPYMIVTSAGTHLAPFFIGYVFLFGTACISGFVLVCYGLSFLFRSSRNVLTTSLVFSLALAIPATFGTTLKGSTLASLLSRINPLDNAFASLDNVLVDYHTALAQNSQHILPVVGFLLLALAFLFLGIRNFSTKGIVRGE